MGKGTRFAGWWLIFIGHHPLDEWDHMLRMRCGRHQLYCCARCTGQLAGFLLGVVCGAWLLSGGMGVYAALSLALPAPATWDWFTQISMGRPSSNWIRMPTGALFGLAIGMWCSAVVHGLWAQAAVAGWTILLYLTMVVLLSVRERAAVREYAERYERFVHRWVTKQ